MSLKLSDFKALSFDCYGTLIDWETGLYNQFRPLVERTNAKLSRPELLALYHEEEHALEEEHPTMLYATVVSTAYERIAAKLGASYTPEEAQAAGASVGRWEPFPDTVEALRRLSKHCRLIVLSNVDKDSFAPTKQSLEHGFTFDKVLTAQEIGSYKPDPRNFEFMLAVALNEFGVPKSQVLVTAQSLIHDHVPANRLDIRSVWIDRQGGGLKAENVKYDWRFATLGEMADALEAELSSTQ